jgi:hypothetical protein
MRIFALVLAVAPLPACVITSDGDGDDSSSSDASAGSVSASASQSTSATAGSASATTASSAGDDSSGGGMSGCESGPLPEPIAGCTPTPPASTGDPAQDCVDRINQFRWECQCLPPLERWADAEACTDEQSGNDQSTNVPHGNFGACGEFAQNTCPNWGSETDVVSGCLQAMWDEGPGEPFEEHGHYINMSNPDYTKVACGFFASEEGVWANQNFSS